MNPEPTPEPTVARAAEMAFSSFNGTGGGEILARTAHERIGELGLAVAHALVVGERVRYPRTPESPSGAAPT